MDDLDGEGGDGMDVFRSRLDVPADQSNDDARDPM